MNRSTRQWAMAGAALGALRLPSSAQAETPAWGAATRLGRTGEDGVLGGAPEAARNVRRRSQITPLFLLLCALLWSGR